MRKLILFLNLIFILIHPHLIFAVNITVSDLTPAISGDDFTFTASISGAQSGTNYLRIDLYKDGTSNYFGETFNGNNWYNGTDAHQYLPIDVEAGAPWTGNITGRIGLPSQTEYDGNGSYKLRIRRYTSSGNYNSTEANESAISVNILFPTQTPVPSATPNPSNTPVPSKTPAPTKTPIPIKEPTKTPIPTEYIVPTKKTELSAVKISPITNNASAVISRTTEVLGKTTEKKLSLTPEPINSTQVIGISGFNPGIIFISIGGVFLLSCGILMYYIQRKKVDS